MFLNDWYSDGWNAALGLVVMGLILLSSLLAGARRCRPVARLLPWALLWHLIVYVYYVLWALPSSGYGSDAWNYHNDGIEVARMIHAGNWASIDWGLNTAALNAIVGFLYTPFGADVYGISFLSAVLGLGGALYMCRAFEPWATPAQTRRYALIILFLPSYGVWAGIFGKDSWIAFGLGLAAYGYSVMQKSVSSKGSWHLAIGLLVTGVVRPHIALVLTVGMAAAYLWGMTQNMRGSAPMKLLRSVVLIAMVVGLYPLTMKFAGLSEDTSADSMEQYMETNGAANAQYGGSVVSVHVAPGVLGMIRSFPRAVVRVLLEPFPWEVRNFNAALAAAENLFIAWIILTYAKNVRRLFREVVQRPYFLFSAFMTLGLMVMFMFVPNLGLLSRQRAQMLPFLFGILVAARADRRRRQLSPEVEFVQPPLRREDRRVAV